MPEVQAPCTDAGLWTGRKGGLRRERTLPGQEPEHSPGQSPFNRAAASFHSCFQVRAKSRSSALCAVCMVHEQESGAL